MTTPHEPDGDAVGAEALLLHRVMRTWMQLAGALEPWRSMPRDDRAGEIASTLAELLDRSGGSEIARRRLYTVAVRHARFRRAQSCAIDVLRGDVSIMREAIVVAAEGAESSSALAARGLEFILSTCATLEQFMVAIYWSGG